jgi:hypothetical protein
VTRSAGIELRFRVLLSMQRALLGVITPALRSVAVSWDEGEIAARFTYETDDPEDIESVREAETRVIADFEDKTTRFWIEVVPMPSPVWFHEGEVFVYQRQEEG